MALCNMALLNNKLWYFTETGRGLVGAAERRTNVDGVFMFLLDGESRLEIQLPNGLVYFLCPFSPLMGWKSKPREYGRVRVCVTFSSWGARVEKAIKGHVVLPVIGVPPRWSLEERAREILLIEEMAPGIKNYLLSFKRTSKTLQNS